MESTIKIKKAEPYIRIVGKYSEDTERTYEDLEDQLVDWISMILDKYGSSVE